jgi:hypothetical protein
VESHSHHIVVAGILLDTCLCLQRYSPERHAFLILSRKDPLFHLESPNRVPGLQLCGPEAT